MKKKPGAGTVEPKAVTGMAIRDTFSMPPDDYSIIERLRSQIAKGGKIFSKSEIVRAGLHALAALDSKALVEQLSKLEKMKPGRKG